MAIPEVGFIVIPLVTNQSPQKRDKLIGCPIRCSKIEDRFYLVPQVIILIVHHPEELLEYATIKIIEPFPCVR